MKKMTLLFSVLMLIMQMSLHAETVNLIENWDGNGVTGAGSEPNQFGWEYTDASMAWGTVNGGGNRYRDGLSKTHEDSKDMSGHRQFMVRWDIGGSSATDYYNYPIGTLEAGKSYEFYWDYAWGNSGTSPNMTLSVGQAKDGSDAIATKLFATPSTKEIYRSGTLTFSCEVSGIYYIKIMSDYNAWFAATNMSITEVPTAQDVTATYLVNAGFDDDCNYTFDDATANIATTNNSASNTQEVTGWTRPVISAWLAGASFEYGFAGTLNGHPVPAIATDGITTGSGNGALGLSVGWAEPLAYTQDLTLPAGSYSIHYSIYNSYTGSQSSTSIVGWVPNSGSSALSSLTSIPSSVWTKDTIAFTLAEETAGKIQVGVTPPNASSSGTPRVFFDYVKIVKEVNPVMTVTSSLLTFDELNLTGTFKVSGANLSEDITITGANRFSVDETTVDKAGLETTITVTFDGLDEDRDYITISSSGLTEKIRVIGRINDAPFYNTGNLISNYNLNSLDGFAGWGSKTITSDTAIVYSGKSCLQMSGACNGSLDYDLSSVLESSTYYRLRAMVHGENFTFYLSQWNIDGSDKVLFTTTENNWAQFDQTVLTGDLTGKTSKVYFNSCENTRGSLAYLDNYELYKMPMYISESALDFLEAGDKTVAVTAQMLTEDITITAPTGFSVIPTTLGSTSDSSLVTITYTGNATTSGYVKFTSGMYNDSVFVEGMADPTLIVSETHLTTDDQIASATFTVTGGNLTEDIAITTPSGFSADNATVDQLAGETTITITFDALAESRGYVNIASSGINKRIRMIGLINTAPLYPTGNLITNPFLNTLDGISGWGAESQSIETDTAIVYSGVGCAKIVGNCGTSFNYSLADALISNTYYCYRTMLKSTGSYRVAFSNAYINDEQEKNHQIPSTNGEWSQFVLEFMTGTVEAGQNIYLNSCGDETGTLAYIDNYELYKMPIHLAADSLIFAGIGDSTVEVTAQLQNTDVDYAITAPTGISIDASSVDADGTIALTISYDNAIEAEGYIVFDNGTYADSIYVKATINTPTSLSTPFSTNDIVFVSNDDINVKMVFAQSSEVTYNVYNLQGALVASQVNNYTIGTHNTVIDANLSKGVYLVNIVKGGQSQTHKIVK